MITALIDAFKEAHSITDEEIAKRIGISESTLTKHRSDPNMALSKKTSRLITDYIVSQVMDAFPTMYPERRLHIMRRLHDFGPSMPNLVDRMSIHRVTKIAWLTYVANGDKIHPDWDH